MQICAGGETTLVSGGGWFFYFIIKILFVSIVPFSAPCLTSLSPCSSVSCCSRQSISGRPVSMAKCSQSCLGLLQDIQEMEQIWKGQWGTMDELVQHQLLTGQL